LELGLSCQQLEQNIPALFTDPACGHVLRAKGFVQDENGWVELNATADGLTANAIPKGQEVLIVIGEGLLGISLGTQNLCTNILFFLLEFWFGRKYIGLGTFVNGICIGYIVTAFYDPIHAHFGDAPSLAVQLAWGITAVLVTALGAGWPCGPWHLDLCVLPWALHPVLRPDVLPEGAAIQTEQLRNPAASNHTLRGLFYCCR
jgi:hypothetical protein